MPETVAPIGVFDSGLGGLSVLRHLQDRLPNESYIYAADSAYAPYGEKSAEFIRDRSMEISSFLLDQGAKLIVVACNTATASAVEHLRSHLDVPIVAMEPGIKPAVSLTRTGKIGVLATSGTLESHRFAQLQNRFGGSVEVFTKACKGWVELVEQGDLSSPAAFESVKAYVRPLVEEGIDTLILGCTHYPFLRSLIEKAAGEGVAILDTGAAVAKRVEYLLSEYQLLNVSGESVALDIYSSNASSLSALMSPRYFGLPVVEIKPLPTSNLVLTK